MVKCDCFVKGGRAPLGPMAPVRYNGRERTLAEAPFPNNPHRSKEFFTYFNLAQVVTIFGVGPCLLWRRCGKRVWTLFDGAGTPTKITPAP